MNRIVYNRRVSFDRADVLLVGALAALTSAYAVGYRLYWGGSRALPAAPAETASEGAPAAVPPVQDLKGLAATAPAPARAWTADPSQEAWDDMTQELSWLVSRRRGRVAVYLRDLRTGRTWTYHDDDMFPSASLIKIPIMASVFYKIRDGDMSLNDVLPLRRHNRVGGSGSLKWRPDGSRITVRELLQHMISESDNTAASMLLEAVGLGYAQQQLSKMGLLYTGIYKEGMSLNGNRVAHENYTTAREMNMLLEKIYRGELVDRPSSALMLEILRHKKAVASRLAKKLPRGWEIAHKTGLLRRACHDSAVIFSPSGDYALTVLTGQNGDYKSAKNFITRVGQITFRYYRGGPRYYARASIKRRVQIALR